MTIKNSSKCQKIQLVAIATLLLLLAINLILNFKVLFPKSNVSSQIYICLITIIPMMALGVFAIFKCKLRGSVLYVTLALLAISTLVRLAYADVRSGDYNIHLSSWVQTYRGMSITDCFVKQVGNYPPLYNYFLILFSRINISDLYLIKSLSFICEIITAIYVAKIVASVTSKPFNMLYVAIILCIPNFLIDSSVWAQCDTMYALFAVMGVYYGINHKSKSCFICMGIGLAVKMQMLLIYPLVLILLLAKDNQGNRYILWRDIWLAPVAFMLASSLPLFFGGSLFKVFKVYFNQTTVGNAGQALVGNCANLSLCFKDIPKGSTWYYILLCLFIAITACIICVIIVKSLKASKGVMSARQILFLSALLPMVGTWFMPKMLDRFFYLAEVFALTNLLVSRDIKFLVPFVWLEMGIFVTYLAVFGIIIGIMYLLCSVFTLMAVINYLVYFAKDFASLSGS